MSLVEELSERADAFAVVSEGLPIRVALAFAKELGTRFEEMYWRSLSLLR